MIDEKIGRLVKLIFTLVVGIVFIPIFIGKVIPYSLNVVTPPSWWILVFEFLFLFLFIVYLYKILKGLS